MNIAIISVNKNKYSETFIHNHVKLLPGNIHFLFEGYLPSKYSIDRGNSEYLLSEFGKRKWFDFYKSKSSNNKEEQINAIKNYLRENKIDVLLCEYGPSGVEMMNIATFLKIPFVVHFHGYDAYRHDILNSYGEYYKEMFDACSAAVAVSKHMGSQLLDIGCSFDKIKLLTYGIDVDIFQKRSKASVEDVFVACGRFVEKKGPLKTIKAFNIVLKNCPSAKLVMIGDGELLQDAFDLVKQLHIEDSVEFKGVMTQLQIAEEFSNATVFVQHSITTDQNDSEGTPLTIMEAMCSGLPIISTKHAGINELVTDNETGYLVDEGDVNKMAEKMLFLIENKEKAKELGENGSRIFIEKYNLQSYTENLFQLLKQQKK